VENSTVFIAVGAAIALLLLLNFVSYSLLKCRIFKRQRWDLNICCGKTDGGGINADIVKHDEVSNFVGIEDIYSLPFMDNQFDYVLCSHTVEHVDEPDDLDSELRRVGRNVVYILPPLWDLSAVLNVFEHQWIFLTWRKKHNKLPPRVRLPFSRRIQKRLGQRIAA
jgi:SAM-dependent methyltransferase